MAATNPPSIGYAAIWSALNAYPAFTATGMVKPGPGTQINAQSASYVPPTSAKDGDRPSVKLGEGRIIGKPYGPNSKVIAVTIAYPMLIASGQYRVDKIGLLYTVVMQALRAAGSQLNNAQNGVYKWDLSPADTKAADAVTKQPQWVTAFSINVTFWILRSDFDSTVFT